MKNPDLLETLCGALVLVKETHEAECVSCQMVKVDMETRMAFWDRFVVKQKEKLENKRAKYFDIERFII